MRICGFSQQILPLYRKYSDDPSFRTSYEFFEVECEEQPDIRFNQGIRVVGFNFSTIHFIVADGFSRCSLHTLSFTEIKKGSKSLKERKRSRTRSLYVLFSLGSDRDAYLCSRSCWDNTCIKVSPWFLGFLFLTLPFFSSILLVRFPNFLLNCNIKLSTFWPIRRRGFVFVYGNEHGGSYVVSVIPLVAQ